MVSVCQSLQRVALQCHNDTQSYWYFHQVVVPCLVGLAVQAAVQGMSGGWAQIKTVLSKPVPAVCI